MIKENYISLEDKILERMDTLQHFFELKDYETCADIIPTISKFYRALTDEDREYLQIVQGEVENHEKTN